MSQDSLYALAFFFGMLVIFTFPFWVALLVHYLKKVTRIGRFKFSLLSIIIVYVVLGIGMKLAIPFIFLETKLSPMFTNDGESTSHLLEYYFNPSEPMLLTVSICLVITVLVPLGLAKYLERRS